MNPYQEFTQIPTENDWHRFTNEVASRVQQFTYEPTDFEHEGKFHCQLNNSAWMTLEAAPELPVLPNVKELHDMDFNALGHGIPGIGYRISLFVHRGLIICTLTVQLDRIPGLLEELAHGAPCLEYLEIYTGLEDTDDDLLDITSIDSIDSSLSQLISLNHAGIPGAIFTSTIMMALSVLPQLVTLRTTDAHSHLQHETWSRPTLERDAFVRLEWLDINAPLPDALWLLRHPHRPHNLTSLILKIGPDHSTLLQCKDWEALLKDIPGAFPLLDNLAINYNEPLNPQEEHFDGELLHVSALLGLGQLAYLRNFWLYFPFPLRITIDQLRLLAIACPRVQIFNIGWPTIFIEAFTPQIYLEDLLIFAEHCPNLLDLWIPFDLKAPQQSAQGIEFKHSLNLSLGTARLPISHDFEQTAARLASMFPNGCELSDGQLSSPGETRYDDIDELNVMLQKASLHDPPWC